MKLSNTDVLIIGGCSIGLLHLLTNTSHGAIAGLEDEPEYHQFHGQPKQAVEYLMKVKQGIAVGVYYHPSIGWIDLLWGETSDNKRMKGYGLSKILAHHPEVINFLKTDKLSKMKAKYDGTNTGWTLWNNEMKFAIKVLYNQQTRNWIMTGYQKIRGK